MALSWEGWVTLAVMVVGLVVMATDVIGPDFVFLGMLGTLLVSTILELKPGLSGFANTGLLTVMILFPVAEGIARTGGAALVLLSRPCLPKYYWILCLGYRVDIGLHSRS